MEIRRWKAHSVLSAYWVYNGISYIRVYAQLFKMSDITCDAMENAVTIPGGWECKGDVMYIIAICVTFAATFLQQWVWARSLQLKRKAQLTGISDIPGILFWEFSAALIHVISIVSVLRFGVLLSAILGRVLGAYWVFRRPRKDNQDNPVPRAWM